MRFGLFAFVYVLVVPIAAPQNPALDAKVDQELPSLVSTYKALHAAPELSHHEDKTAALLANELRGFGYDVTEHVGKYPNPQWQGHGIVAILKNGPGPTVLVRAALAGFTVEEAMGRVYARRGR